ncbi:MAG: VOC family protein [Acidimicrobiales bacterium]
MAPSAPPPPRLPPADVTESLPSWRYQLGSIRTTFRARSFAGAAVLIQALVSAADEADHHPDLDLRFPGVVHVTLTTHDAPGVTQLDVGLARTFDRLAEALRCEQSAPAPVLEVAIDALDRAAIVPFWQTVLGYRPEPGALDDGGVPHTLVDPARLGPAVWFQRMDEPRAQRNRIHFDLTVPHDEAEDRVAAALAVGGTLVSADRARAFWVLADAEGNEICMCTWQDRE